MFFWLPFALVKTLQFARTKRVKTLLAFTVLLWVFSPIYRPTQLRKWWFWKHWLRYWPVRVVFEDSRRMASPMKGPVLFCTVPHGIYPFGTAMMLIDELVDVFGEIRPIAADIVFKIPVIGHLIRFVCSNSVCSCVT